MKPRIIDANGLVLGRMASKVAKMLLLGEKIVIINAEKAIVSGNKRMTIHHYKERQNIRTHYNPIKGPFWPKSPDRIVRRTVRGMLPWRIDKGRIAYRNLQVYRGIPENLAVTKDEIETFSDISIDQLKGRYIELGALAKELGSKR